jgi:hypothetical protein
MLRDAPGKSADDGGWRTWAKLGGAVALLGAAAWYYSSRSSADESPTSRQDYNTRLHCLTCGQDSTANLNVADEPPHPCGKCKALAAWKLKKCNACGHIFCPEPSGDPPRQPIIPTCPKCKSGSTGAAPIEPGTR